MIEEASFMQEIRLEMITMIPFSHTFLDYGTLSGEIATSTYSQIS